MKNGLERCTAMFQDSFSFVVVENDFAFLQHLVVVSFSTTPRSATRGSVPRLCMGFMMVTDLRGTTAPICHWGEIWMMEHIRWISEKSDYTKI